VDNQWSNPKALRVLSRVEEGVSATEWAISGELENHTSTKSHGNAAVSGVSKKYTPPNVFAGHSQSIDYTGQSSTEGGAMVGVEINLKANGNDDAGVRIGLDMPAKTQAFDGLSTQRGQYAAAIRVHNPPGQGPPGGIWKKGLHIYDNRNFSVRGQPMPVGIQVETRGRSGISVKGSPRAGIVVNTSGADGIRIIGTNRTSALKIPKGAYISLDSAGKIRLRYEEDANDDVVAALRAT
jgi:hypothetical protein